MGTRRLKLFNNHLEYTEYMNNNEVPIPNVSYCNEEDEVHYNNVMVLPGNEEVWELYSSLVCDDERLDRDLKNIFSKYLVTVQDKTMDEYVNRESVYQDTGKLFTYNTFDFIYECFIKTHRNPRAPQYALDSIENDCGQNVLPGGVGLWTGKAKEIVVGPSYPVIT